MQYRAFSPGIEVAGESVRSLVEGFSFMRTVPSTILVSEGIGEARPDGMIVLHDDQWYSHDAVLRAFERIASEVGRATLRRIGKTIPEHARFPESVTDVESALMAIDVAYHLNHRRNGIVMFNPDTGVKMKGLGSYECSLVPGENKAIMRCANPYPCAFDEGLIEAMAERFAPYATVSHDPDSSCREKRADECTYVVTW